MQVNTEKDNARGSEYSPKLLVINAQINYYKFEQLHKRVHPVSTARASFSFLNYG